MKECKETAARVAAKNKMGASSSKTTPVQNAASAGVVPKGVVPAGVAPKRATAVAVPIGAVGTNAKVEPAVSEVFGGIDLHAACAVTALRFDNLSLKNVRNIAPEEFCDFARKLLERFPNARLRFCYEAGPCGFWLARDIAALGAQTGRDVECLVVAPENLNGRRKTDARDAHKLLAALVDFTHGNDRALANVWVPPPQVEGNRLLLRYRTSVLRDFGRVMKRAKSHLLLQGVHGLRTRWWRASNWREALPATLPKPLEWELRELRDMMLYHAEKLAIANAKLETIYEEAVAAATAVADCRSEGGAPGASICEGREERAPEREENNAVVPSAPRQRSGSEKSSKRARKGGAGAIVQSVAAASVSAQNADPAARVQVPCGIGKLTWLTLCVEIGDFSRFKRVKHIASYTGLCPGEHSSGTTRRELSIDKRGNSRVRHVLIEAAWRLVRYQSDYPPVRHFFGERPEAGSRNRRKAIVAVARHLICDLWRLATHRKSAEEIGLRLSNA